MVVQFNGSKSGTVVPLCDFQTYYYVNALFIGSYDENSSRAMCTSAHTPVRSRIRAPATLHPVGHDLRYGLWLSKYPSLKNNPVRNKIMKKLNVLIACEESQTEMNAFRTVGCNAFSCDIQKPKRGADLRYQIHGDVTPYLQGQTSFVTMDGKKHNLSHWDLIVAHPPSTYLCKVGSIWLYKGVLTKCNWQGKDIEVNYDRLQKMKLAREFFMMCLAAKAEYVAVENPLPLALAELPQPSCYVQPYWFGHPYSKKTLFWLKNLPPIMPQKVVSNFKEYMRSSRGKYRSRSFSGIAQAMAEQWISYIKKDIISKQEIK